MTTQELLYVQMFSAEKKKWQELCESIREKIVLLKLPAMAYTELERVLTPGMPHSGVKGYVESDGFFYVEEGDRGNCNLIFKTQSREEAEELLMKKLAHDVSYRCVVAEMKQIEQEHRKDWRFYTVVDNVVPGRVFSHEEENATWKYNTKYDYRKYWFEMALYMLSGNVPERRFQAEVAEYEALMNHWFEQPFWKYSVEKLEFVCI